jgi:DNA-3-methyladenine glycosylase I
MKVEKTVDLVDGKPRCPWMFKVPEYLPYHDHEWGTRNHDDGAHFEFLVMENFQAGLSWAAVFRKRENYRKAFAGFDPVKVARFSEAKIDKLAQDARIIRNRQKIKAVVNNAKRFLEVQKEFGSFDAYLWRFVNGKPIAKAWKRQAQIPVTNKVSDKLSADLKKRGFQFVGSTTMYAHMQTFGLVNDHVVSCFRFSELTRD